jgi:hypothetical protein
MEGNASQIAVFIRNILSTPEGRQDRRVPRASMALVPMSLDTMAHVLRVTLKVLRNTPVCFCLQAGTEEQHP